MVKKGFSKEREQRYLCKDCGRTFCARTERIGCRSRLPKEVWMRYAECFVECRPLRACAEECGVSTKRLPSYLAWFAWTRYFAAGVADQVTASTVARQMSEGLCRTRTAEMFNAEQPYMDYWESQEAA